MTILYKEIRVESIVNHWCVYGNNGAITCISNAISSSGEKHHDLQARIKDEYRRGQNCHGDKALVDRVFSTGITSYQIPTSVCAMILHYIYASVIQEIYLIFFLTVYICSFYSSNWLYLYVQSWKSNTLEISYIILYCTDQTFSDLLTVPWARMKITSFSYACVYKPIILTFSFWKAIDNLRLKK